MAEDRLVKNEPPDNVATSESPTKITTNQNLQSDAKDGTDLVDASGVKTVDIIQTKQELEQGSNEDDCTSWLYCDDCGKSLQSAVSMEMHKIYSCNKKKKHRFKCKNCGKKLRSKETVKLHMKTMHSADKEKPANFPCHLCDKSYKVRHRLTHHMHIVHSQKNYSCDKCNKGFPSKKLVEKHIEKVHTDREKVSCPKCSQLFATPHSMQRHLTTQHRRCKCLLCGQRFFTLESGYDHMSVVHVGHEAPFKCTICADFITDHRSEFEKHMRTHIADMSDSFPIRNYMNQKPLKCLLCGRRVDWQTSEKHIRESHIPDESPFKCLICQYSDNAALYLYDDAETLVKHLTSHVALVEQSPSFSPQKLPNNAQDQSSTLPYKCLLCHKRLPDIKAGISHMKSDHLPESSSSLYCCTICQYTDLKHPGKYEYTNPENFVEHLLIHLVKAKCVSQPSPASVKEELCPTENGSFEIPSVNKEISAESAKTLKTSKNLVKTQCGAKTKALMKWKLHAKTIAKRQGSKQLAVPYHGLKEEVPKNTAGSGKQRRQSGKAGQGLRQQQHPSITSKTSKQVKQLSKLEGLSSDLTQNTKQRRLLTKSVRGDTIDDLQPTIDPFEFTDKEFDFALENVLCINNENEAAEDDIPLAQLANRTKQQGHSYLKAVKIQTQNYVKQAVQTKIKPNKLPVKAKSKGLGTKRNAKMKRQKLVNGKDRPQKVGTNGRVRHQKVGANGKDIPQKVGAKAKVIKRKLKADQDVESEGELESVLKIEDEVVCEADSATEQLQNKREKAIKPKKEATTASKIPQQKNKQKIKVKQKKTDDVKLKTRISGTKPVKRKAKKDVSGDDTSPIKRRKTRLAKKLAKEAKKIKKQDGPPRKTILSSKDMLDILEDVKNECKMKKKRNKKVKSDPAEKVEDKNESKNEIRVKRKGSDKTGPNKKRKTVKAVLECQDNKERDLVTEIIDQVARGNIEKPRKIKAKSNSTTNVKLKIRLTSKVQAIGGKGQAIGGKVGKVQAIGGKVQAISGKAQAIAKTQTTPKVQAVSGKIKAVVKRVAGKTFVKVKTGTKGKKKGVIGKARGRKPRVKNIEEDMKESNTQVLVVKNIEDPELKSLEQNDETNVQIEVKRNPKIKTTDEMKRQLKINKPRFPPVLNDDFKDAKLKLSVSPKKDDRLAKLIASVAKSLHMEVEIEGEEKGEISETTKSQKHENNSEDPQTKTTAQHEAKKTDPQAANNVSLPTRIRVESASSKDDSPRDDSAPEPNKTSLSPKMAATTSEGAVAPSTDLHVKGSPGAKQVGNPTAIMEVKKELFLNGNEAPADIQQSVEMEAKMVSVPEKSVEDERFKYKCDVCGRRYMQEYSYQRHIICHTGDHPYSCNICDASYSCPGTLEKHKRTHTGEKPYKCTICGRGFTQSTNRNRHMMTHTGLKPWKCPTCGKGFQQKIHVEAHLSSVHSATSQYMCSVCKREFTRPDALKRHLRIHTGERPFSCSFCPKTFGRKECLKTHVASYHNKAQSECNMDNSGPTPPAQLIQEDYSSN